MRDLLAAAFTLTVVAAFAALWAWAEHRGQQARDRWWLQHQERGDKP